MPSPTVKCITSDLSHNFTPPAVSVQQSCDPPLWSWASLLTTDPVRLGLHVLWFALRTCTVLIKVPRLLIISPKEQRPKLWTQRMLDQAFPQGWGWQRAPSREKLSFKVHSVDYTVLIMESTTSQHANLLLPEPCSVFFTGDGENSVYY